MSTEQVYTTIVVPALAAGCFALALIPWIVR